MKKSLRAPVAITGLGAVSAVGHGTRALWRALEEGRDGIRPIERFSTEGFSVHNAALVPGAKGDPKATGDIALELAIEAGREAIAHARLGETGTLGEGQSGAAARRDAPSGTGTLEEGQSGAAARGDAPSRTGALTEGQSGPAARGDVPSGTGALGGGQSEATVLADRVDPAAVAPARVAIVFGTSLATHPEGIHRLAELMGDAIGARGPKITVSTACSSSANAIGVGRDLVLEGLADVAIAGGADALTGEIFAGFHNLGLLAPDRCAPFSSPPGTTLGEGAGFLVLERADHAARRGASPVAWVSGMGLSCDAYHATSPDPAGGGIARAARAALADAGLSANDIDYVNAHGTGTEANDPAEWRGLSQVLGDRAASVPVSATKSVIGHGQGAAGVLEIIATLLAMQRGAIPQTLHHVGARPRCPPDPVAQAAPRPHAVAHALCDSSAFGGANALVTIDAKDRPAPSRSVDRREVVILGSGVILPGIGDVAALADLLGSQRFEGFREAPVGTPPIARGASDLGGADAQRAAGGGHPSERIRSGSWPSGRVPQGAPPRSLAGVDLRGFDPLSRLLTFATAEALRDAGVSLRGALRDRAGLFAALARISPASAHELDDSVNERGLLRLSAPAFTRVVLNASTGAAARSLQLRGPTTTITTGRGGGLAALVLACDHLALRDDADLLCAASADEIDPDEAPETLCEAGACVVLGTPAVAPSRPLVRVAGWGVAGPGEVELASARALEMAGIEGDRPSPSGAPDIAAPAASVLLGVAVAARRLRAGPDRTVLLAHDNRSLSTAVVLQRIDP